MKRVRIVVCALLFSLLLSGCGSDSQDDGGTPTPPRGQTPTLTLATIASGLSQPLDLQVPGDGSGRLFVVEQGGRIRIIQNGTVMATPFLDISEKIEAGGEKGLLGLAFDPNYNSNGRFYVNYTRRSSGVLQTVIARYTRSSSNPQQADPNSELPLLIVDQPPFDNHKAGQLAFGPDGFLYIGLGDGGGGGDPEGNGQDTNTLLGKMLRIDVNNPSGGRNYGIPAGNPFASGSGGLPEIFAIGFRNPWRFSFDRNGGTFFVADVGQSSFEEIDIVTAGGNYGWNIMEGSSCFSPASGCNMAGLTQPIHAYPRTDGTTVIGGYVYRGTQIQGLAGSYVFGDFGSGRIWRLTGSGTNWSRSQLLETGRSLSSFGQGEDGELYVSDYAGTVLQIRPQS